MLKEYPKFTAAAVQTRPGVPRQDPSTSTCRRPSTTRSRPSRRRRPVARRWSSSPNSHIPGYCHFALELTKGPEYTSIWAEYLRHGIEVPSEETDILCRAARREQGQRGHGHQRAGGQVRRPAAQLGACSSTSRGEIVARPPQDQHHRPGTAHPYPRQRRPEPGHTRVRLRQDQRPHLRRAQSADALEQLHHPGDQGQLLDVAGISGRRRGTTLGHPGRDHCRRLHRRLLVRAGR